MNAFDKLYMQTYHPNFWDKLMIKVTDEQEARKKKSKARKESRMRAKLEKQEK